MEENSTKEWPFGIEPKDFDEIVAIEIDGIMTNSPSAVEAVLDGYKPVKLHNRATMKFMVGFGFEGHWLTLANSPPLFDLV